MSEHELRISVPLDSDGFLRRECPTCEREFKWLPTAEGHDGTPMPDGGYFCPYCRVQAPGDAWHTPAQIESAQNRVMTDIVGPEVQNFQRKLRGLNRPGGLVKFEAKYKKPRPLDPLVEDDDMRRIDFACHPAEPVKVLDDWSEPVHCLICANPA